MSTRKILALLALALAAFMIVGCTAEEAPETDEGTPPVGEEISGLRLAPGLYDLEDGTAQAVGTLEWQDLEGGFWAIVGGTESEGNLGTIVAVIANGEELADQLEPLAGRSVMVTGKRVEGASIRMAGPEIEVDKVEAFSDTPGIAE